MNVADNNIECYLRTLNAFSGISAHKQEVTEVSFFIKINKYTMGFSFGVLFITTKIFVTEERNLGIKYGT